MEYLDSNTKCLSLNKDQLCTLQNNLIWDHKDKLSVVVTLFLAEMLDDPNALFTIGSYYMNGTFFDLNRYLGFEYYFRSASHNYPKALFYLGLTYRYGIGCNRSKNIGRELIEKSSQLGFKLATDYLQKKDEYKDVNKTNAPLVITIGSYFTGKTTFLNKIRDINNNCLPASTIGYHDVFFKCKNFENKKFYIRFRNTMGMEKFDSLVQNYGKGAKAALVFFDLNDLETFMKIDLWMHKLEEIEDYNNMKLIFIGNKLDKERSVSKPEAILKAEQYNAEYFEISALTGQNVEYPCASIVNYFKNSTLSDENNEIYTQNLLERNTTDQKNNKKLCCK